MIDHVFLPRKSLVNYPNSRLESTEKCLLLMMCDIINDFQTIHIPETVKQLYDNMKHLYSGDQIDPEVLSTRITGLQPEGMLGVYIRGANCGLFLKRMKSVDKLVVATFQVNLSTDRIYESTESIQVCIWKIPTLTA